MDMDREREPEWILKRCVHFYIVFVHLSEIQSLERNSMCIDIDQDICNRAAEQLVLKDNLVSDDVFSHKAT